MQLDHFNVHVHDLAAARDFFERLLGAEAGWRPSFTVPGHWLYVGGKPVIHTWLASEQRGLGWVDHVAFNSSRDPETMRTELQRQGFDFAERPLVDTDLIQFFVTGPEGMKIELQCKRQDAGASAQAAR